MQGLRILYRLMTRARRRQLIAVALLMLLGIAAEMLTIGAVLPFLALASDPESDLIAPQVRDWLAALGGTALVGAAIVLALAAFVSTAVRLLLAWTSQSFVMKLGHELATAIFSRVLRQPYAAYLQRHSSEVVSAMEKVHFVVSALLQPAMQGAIAAIMALFVGTLLFVINALAATLGAVIVIAAYALMHRATSARVRGNSRVLARKMTERAKIVQEALGGMRDIILEQSQDLFEEKFRIIDRSYRRAAAVNLFIAGSPRFVVEGAGIMAIAAVTLAMSFEPGGLMRAIPVLGALALGAQRLLPLIQQTWHGWSQASGNLQSLQDIVAILAAADEPRLPPAKPLPLERSVAFDRLSFSYAGGGFALRDIDLHIRKGERVGIAGPSGSGKSTLLDLLMGLLEPGDGAVLVDGRPLNDQLRRRWQAAIAHVPQSIFLADDTIAANIAFASPGPLDAARIRAAAEAARLGDFLAGVPDGLETRVGERGIRLCGGQRQRIGIARALYKGATLLVLDEATSALDEKIEAEVMQSIAELPNDLTIVIVAHRRSTMQGCSRILRLESGRLVEERQPA